MRASIPIRILICGAAFLSASTFGAAEAGEKDNTKPAARSRTFEFTYSGAVTGLPEGTIARVWLPMPPSNEEQTVKVVSKDIPPKAEINEEKVYGNRVLSFDAPAAKDGEISFSIKYLVTRREVSADVDAKERAPIERLLQPDEKVPIDGKPLELIKDKNLPKDQLALGRMFYDVVNGHMRYNKDGTGWGRGDSVWACENGRGNCSDFHSLFISLVRSQKMPATFIIGFPLPEKHGSGEIPGYHCWAKFRPQGKGWVPVDISEANKNPKMREYYFGHLTPDRVALSTGRDLTLVPKQEGGPLNFFVYPYVEVGGKPYPEAKLRKRFSFKDVEIKE